MTRLYKEFLVHGEQLQAPIPSTSTVQRVARASRRGCHADADSVARVRPRTSKGITDLLLRTASRGWAPLVPLRSEIDRRPEPASSI